MAQIVLLFLLVMAVLAVLGKFRRPEARKGGKCPKCGRPLLGATRCPCGGRA